MDYLPLKPGDPDSAWSVVNVSAKSDFNVEFGDTQETTVTSASTDTSSHSIGGSAELDVKKTFSVGIPVISNLNIGRCGYQAELRLRILKVQLELQLSKKNHLLYQQNGKR